MNRITNDTKASEKVDFGSFQAVSDTSKRPVSDPDLVRLVHHRAAEIHQRIRLIRSRLQHKRDILVFDYILDNTLGRNKASDHISNSQFIAGKKCKKTGKIIDFGCNLRSLKSIRLARKALIGQGVIFEIASTDESGASLPNRYGLMFIQELLDLQKLQRKCRNLKQHTQRGYYLSTPTDKFPTEIKKQRCIQTKQSKSKKKFHTDPHKVDYLANLMVQATKDTESRAAFAKIALCVDEGQIMELLSVLKDRGNIRNKGAWLWTTAQHFMGRKIIKADAIHPASTASKIYNQQPIVSPEWIAEQRKKLQQKLQSPIDLSVSNQGQRTLSDFKKWCLQNHDPT